MAPGALAGFRSATTRTFGQLATWFAGLEETRAQALLAAGALARLVADDRVTRLSAKYQCSGMAEVCMVTPATIEPDIAAAEIIPTTAFALMSAFISFPFFVWRPFGSHEPG
jgi:hypothetical protein